MLTAANALMCPLRPSVLNSRAAAAGASLINLIASPIWWCSACNTLPRSVRESLVHYSLVIIIAWQEAPASYTAMASLPLSASPCVTTTRLLIAYRGPICRDSSAG